MNLTQEYQSFVLAYLAFRNLQHQFILSAGTDMNLFDQCIEAKEALDKKARQLQTYTFQPIQLIAS